MNVFVSSMSLLLESEESLSCLIKRNPDLSVLQLLIYCSPHEGKLLSSSRL